MSAAATAALAYRLQPGVVAELDPPDGRGARTLRLVTSRGPVTFTAMSAGRVAVIEALETGAAEATLLGCFTAADGADAPAWLYFTLARLLQLGVAELVLRAGDADAAVVRAIGRDFQLGVRAVPAGLPVRISRFAYLRNAEGVPLLESPRALAEVQILDGSLLRLWPALAAGVDAAEVGDQLQQAWLDLLFRCGFLEPVIPGEAARADAQFQALEQWEFPDLLFHSRSRFGRHRNPYGGTYRFAGQRQPLPAVKQADWSPRLDLPRPDLAALRRDDPPFAEVLETRQSRRRPGPQPLGAGQLGEFLYRTARVRGRMRSDHEEISSRPYPGGGADYELELYLAIHRVDGVDPGLWWYDPLGHALLQLGPWNPAIEALARDVASKAPPGEIADVTILVTGRFQRLTFKYQSIAYAVMLKDLGVLYQTFYLAATAMGLSASAVGGGDADLFATVSGVPYVVEPQIGEFLLNAPHPDEAAGHQRPREPR